MEAARQAARQAASKPAGQPASRPCTDGRRRDNLRAPAAGAAALARRQQCAQNRNSTYKAAALSQICMRPARQAGPPLGQHRATDEVRPSCGGRPARRLEGAPRRSAALRARRRILISVIDPSWLDGPFCTCFSLLLLAALVSPAELERRPKGCPEEARAGPVCAHGRQVALRRAPLCTAGERRTVVGDCV